MKGRSTSLICLTGMAILFLSARPAEAEFDGEAAQDGLKIIVTKQVLHRANAGLDLQTGEPDPRVFEYASATTCQLSAPGGVGADLPCMAAIQACAGNTPQEGLGPQVTLYRRELGANGAPTTGWLPIGTTCLAEKVPGKRVLDTLQILAAFRNTAFAKPAVHMQPEGNVTLVTLSTYFKVTWPADGFGPGEIDPVTLMGYQLRIRPTSLGYTYVFGDRTSSGPTFSSGGTYPNGDVTHAYTKAGVYDSHIDITYGGEYSVNGSEWIPVLENGNSATVQIRGQVQAVTVRTARARLVIK